MTDQAIQVIVSKLKVYTNILVKLDGLINKILIILISTYGQS